MRQGLTAGLIFFVTDVHSAKEDEIEAAPDVGLVFIHPKDKAYLSITGRARVMRDAAKMKVFWRKTDEVWWPGGPTDSDVCLLRIEPLTKEKECTALRNSLTKKAPYKGHPPCFDIV